MSRIPIRTANAEKRNRMLSNDSSEETDLTPAEIRALR